MSLTMLLPWLMLFFFYLGCGDSVQCCYCDLKLEKWDPRSDLPQEEHDRESTAVH